ncbi:MAG: cytosolic protein [Elusimicrobiota bacterium]|jgi:site-specific DNA-methyltransferase (cytosine-N4-specific)|nr:cytosolic protein [Elusimicrobiota bacterium]
MKKLNYNKLKKFIEEFVVIPFYDKRTEKLKELSLNDILSRKNPYLFRAKNIQTAGELADDILNAHLSSQEETIFGNLLEELAIHINSDIFGGKKAEEGKFKSIDLIFEKDNKKYLVGIKSGPHWGNADQLRIMQQSFIDARKILKNEGWKKEIVCINGCIYGKDNKPFKQDKNDDRKNYYKYCGQEFWKFISGDNNLYKTIIEPLGNEVKQRDEKFKELYVKVANKLTKDLLDNFTNDNAIDWEKILEFVSKKN